jgi:predicted deacylase
MAAFDIAGQAVEPGTVLKTMLGEVALAPGIRVGVPVVVVRGVEDGPTLVVTAAMHGQEIVGTGAVVQAVRTVRPDELRGTLVAIPIANPLAVANGTYVTPYDGMNLCGPLYWPPIANGTITQRIAALIAPMLHRADYYIDVHGNPDPAARMTMMYLDQCRDEATRAETVRIADAFGLTPVDMPTEPEAHSTAILGPITSYPTGAACSHGIPSIMVELTGNVAWRDSPLGSTGIRNVMKALGMLEGVVEEQECGRLAGDYVYWGALMAESGGFLWPREAPGTVIDAGGVILEIADVWGDVVQTIQMPVEGFCWGYLGGLFGMGTHAVPEGSMVGFVARKTA